MGNTEVVGDRDLLRPSTLEEFVGQEVIVEDLRVYSMAAKGRGTAMDHVLLAGPPGSGKTTLALLVARELGTVARVLSAPAIEKPYDLVTVLMGLRAGDVLFLDEIHRLKSAIEEILYSAMEDYKLDIVVGEGATKRAVTTHLHPFTLVGATTRMGLLGKPLRERFGIPIQMEPYTDSDLARIVARGSRVMQFVMHPEACLEVGRRSRGTPRVALNLTSRIRDHASALGLAEVDIASSDSILRRLGVDANGLNQQDRKYLVAIRDTFRGGPVGLVALSAVLGEETDVLEHSIEPYLIQIGYVARTPRGRVLTGKWK